jgi:hypothetical protein
MAFAVADRPLDDWPNARRVPFIGIALFTAVIDIMAAAL